MYVNNSSNFQAAVDAAPAGGTIVLGPGVGGTVTVNTDDLTIVGQGSNGGELDFGAAVTDITLIASVPYGGSFSVYGNDLGDTIVTRGLADNAIYGGSGNDDITVSGGFDSVQGNGGTDTLRVNYAAATDNVTSGGGSSAIIDGGSLNGVELYVNYQGISKLVLTTGSGDDTLNGTAGADVLNGGHGADTMSGGAGNDTYFVDNIGDQVFENGLAGTDTVKSSISYTLTSNVEHLTLIGTQGIDGTGNNLKNTIVGNRGDNVLDGKDNDDILTGGGGHNTFVFDTTLGPPAPPPSSGHPLLIAIVHNVDTITDFSAANDMIDLDHHIFSAFKTGALASEHFAVGGPTNGEAQILYVSWTGNLLYDADGTGPGGAVEFAHLATGLALTADNFMVL